MKISRLTLHLTLLIMLAGFAPAQSALFVMISPSTSHNGMGEAGVATPTTDPSAAHYNPAAGTLNFDRGVFATYSHMKTEWLPGLVDDMWLTYSSAMIQFLPWQETVTPGLNVRSLIMAKSRTYLDAGVQTRTGPNGEDLGSFKTEFYSNNTTLGLGVQYEAFGVPFDLGVGLTYKVIEQYLLGQDNLEGSAKSTAFDGGIIARTSAEFELNDFGFSGSLHATPTLGYSIVNIGDMVVFNDASQADPLPRYARLGMSLDLDYDNGKVVHPARLHFARSAEDYLGYYADNEWQFDVGLGEIDFLRNVLAQESSEGVIISRGWEVSFFETLRYREGRYIDDDGKVLMDTFGYEVSLVGILQLSGIMDLIENKRTANGRYFDIVYVYAKYIPDGGEYHPLHGTEFESIRLEVTNFEALLKKF